MNLEGADPMQSEDRSPGTSNSPTAPQWQCDGAFRALRITAALALAWADRAGRRRCAMAAAECMVAPALSRVYGGGVGAAQACKHSNTGYALARRWQSGNKRRSPSRNSRSDRQGASNTGAHASRVRMTSATGTSI